MEIELLRARARAAEQRLPFVRRSMSATTSAATRRCFGIQRVCQVWERSRSALYARRARAHQVEAAGGDSDRSRAVPVPRRRPSQGASDPGGIRVHAGAARHAGARTSAGVTTHDGRVITQAPNVMFGIHRRRVRLASSRTLERGVRGVALQSRAASRHSIRLRKGSVSIRCRRRPWAGLRMDGSQYLSDFLKQRYWGIHPSFGFVEEPETRCGGAVESYAQGASDPRPNLSEPRGRPGRRGRRQ